MKKDKKQNNYYPEVGKMFIPFYGIIEVWKGGREFWEDFNNSGLIFFHGAYQGVFIALLVLLFCL